MLSHNGASKDATDFSGNTALHVKCLGKSGHATEVECIEKLVS